MATKKKEVVAPVEEVTSAPVEPEESEELVTARAKEAELQTAYLALEKWGINRLSGLVEALSVIRKQIQDIERL